MPQPEINSNLLNFIKVNRDAVATNRGFYYQYLNVVLKWINNFVDGIDNDTYTEVDEDIKEIGNQLIFTQIKCYSSVFSFKSTEIKKALLNFFTLYLENQNNKSQLVFHFITNTATAKGEDLLKKWVSEQPNLKKNTLDQCTSTVSDILFEEINQKAQKFLDKKNITNENIQAFESNLSEFKKILSNKAVLNDFIKKINWDFGNIHSEEAIQKIISEILNLLENPIFESKSKKLLLDVLLSEIYRISQLSDQSQRKVNSKRLKDLLKATDDELVRGIDVRLTRLFHSRIETLETEVIGIKQDVGILMDTQKVHGEKLNKINTAKIIPHLLTTIPYLDASLIVGRDEIISELHTLQKNHKHICINGNGGMGKSTLLKKYVAEYKGEYNHIIWINVETGLVNSICLNEQLAENIDFPITNEEEFSKRFNLILNKLNQIAGNNLLIIDSYGDREPELSELRSLQNWKIIVGTRLRLQEWKILTAKKLNFDDAKAVYYKNSDESYISNEQFESLFRHVEYNTLVIGLVAKTIKNSFDLTLEIVLEHFDNQSLDDVSLGIDLPDESGESPNLLRIINKTFDLSKIDDIDAYYLSFLAILPLEDTNFSDLVDWFGEESETSNRKALTNAINALHSKGLIERIGKQITVHKVLRDSIIYQERLEQSPFLSQFHNVLCLTSLLSKASDYNLSHALRFLKFGEAMLEVIKEPHRKTIYQPLLALENEVLHIYNWLRKDNLADRWASLFERAEKYLYPQDPLLGFISNNYGLVLASDGNMNAAFLYFEKAVSILSLYQKILPKLFISICNLCHLFIQKKEFDRFQECFENLMDLRKKHNIYDDVSMPIQSQLLALAYYEACNFPEAIKSYKYTIAIHKELPKESRNDAYLMYYYTKLGESFFFNKELENAETASVMAFNTFLSLNAKVLNYPHPIFNLMHSIALVKDDQELITTLQKAREKYKD